MNKLFAFWAVRFNHVLFFLGLSWGSIATTVVADIYMETAVSIEWLVDSSDKIVTVEIVDDPQDETLAAKRLEVLKGDNTSGSTNESSFEMCRLNKRPRSSFADISEQWLLMIRGSGTNERVIGAVNLSNPRRHFLTAAITIREGELCPMNTSEEILEFVRQRVAAGTSVPRYADRDLTDLMRDQLGSGQEVAALIGGFPLAVESGFWDQGAHDPNNQDTIIDSLIVPRGTTIPAHAYDRTRQRIVSKYGRFGWNLSQGKLPTSHPLAGTYELLRNGIVLRMTLHPEGTALIAVPYPADESSRKPDDALKPGLHYGSWEFRNGSLAVFSDTIWSRMPNPNIAREIQIGKRLVSGALRDVSPDAIHFASSANSMYRVDTPVRSFPYLPRHPWYDFGKEKRRELANAQWDESALP